MAKYFQVNHLWRPNKTNKDKVESLIQSMLKEGWIGNKLLYHRDNGFVEGSHRLKSLEIITDRYPKDKILKQEVAHDITEIIETFCLKHDIDFFGLEFDVIQEMGIDYFST